MKFNPITKELFSDSGQFIKRLYCPWKIRWDQLKNATAGENKVCSACNHEIIDTANLNDRQVMAIVRDNAGTCLKLDLNQPNINVITNGFFEQR